MKQHLSKTHLTAKQHHWFTFTDKQRLKKPHLTFVFITTLRQKLPHIFSQSFFGDASFHLMWGPLVPTMPLSFPLPHSTPLSHRETSHSPYLKGQFYFIGFDREDSPNGFYSLSHTKSFPVLGHLPMTTQLLLPDSTPYKALFLASWSPKPRPSAVGARAEHQAEGAEASSSLLQF